MEHDTNLISLPIQCSVATGTNNRLNYKLLSYMAQLCLKKEPCCMKRRPLQRLDCSKALQYFLHSEHTQKFIFMSKPFLIPQMQCHLYQTWCILWYQKLLWIVMLPLWSGHIVAHSKSKPMCQQVTCYWRNKGPHTLHTKLQRFFWKICCENHYRYIKLLKKLLQSWKKVAMCMDDNCSFVCSVQGP